MAAKMFRDPAADDLASHDAARPGLATCPLCRRLRPPHGPQHWPPRARGPLLRGLVHPSLAGGLLCPSWTGQHFMGLCVFVRISKGMSEPRFAWASLVQGPVWADTLPVVTPPGVPCAGAVDGGASAMPSRCLSLRKQWQDPVPMTGPGKL